MGKKLLRWLLAGTFVGLAIGAVIGLVLSRFVELPAVESLTTYRPSAATQVRARDGSLIATFANERRIPLTTEQIPRVFRDAVIAVEDASFYKHTGVDPKGIARAIFRNLLSRRSTGQGGSTITQQLARTLFLTPEKKWDRKVKEALLAIEIEQKFSKDQIFTLYANQVNFGHGNYGVEAASRFYLGKPASQLTLPEAALLAGLPQRPTDLSPISNPSRALSRRNHVLERMFEERMIDAAALRTTREAPLAVEPHYDRNPTAAYFIEEVRRSVEDRFGSRQMLEGGLNVETTLDPKLQEQAESSLREGLVAQQRRLGWPRARRNHQVEGIGDLRGWRDPSWSFLEWREGELVHAVVVEPREKAASLTIAGRPAELLLESARWTGRSDLTRIMNRGDVLLVRLGEVPSDHAKPIPVELEPEPRVEGSLVVLDNRTGAILALVGGFDFDRSQFDRAMQAKRQCGSAFKPFVFLAAWEQGFSPNETIYDGPCLLPDESGLPTYVPLNYERKYFGTITLRDALERSHNASAVKLQQMVTGESVIDVARRLGLKEKLAPYPTLALGAFEVTLVDLAAAYSGIANRGEVAEPHFITRVKDADGRVIGESRPKVRQALRPEVAYLMTHVMEGVVDRGTAGSAAGLPGNLAGKTGTTDDYTDAWFIGSTPRITCGVWVGRDMKEPIGRKMTGAEAALPTWIRFMKPYLEALPDSIRNEEFAVPAGVALVPVDKRTGLRATPACGDDVLLEAVLAGHEPQECSPQMHSIAGLGWLEQLPYYTPRPNEPPTTAAAIEAAFSKMAGRDESRRPED